jgi:hypothetical protein
MGLIESMARIAPSCGDEMEPEMCPLDTLMTTPLPVFFSSYQKSQMDVFPGIAYAKSSE